jgi:hypothetical protein
LRLWRWLKQLSNGFRQELFPFQTFEQAAHHIVLEDYIAAVKAAKARRDRLTAQIEAAWCYRFPARVNRELLLRQEA